MRIFLIILGLLSIAEGVLAQFGNEWIVPNQQYYKLSVAEDGAYRVSYADLQAAGFPVAGVDPRRIQLFFRGQEQAIVVQGQQDARFDPTDFVLFYGQRNDGTLDQELYVDPAAQPHRQRNLYSDTTAYFLTWRLDAGVGKRMNAFSENNITNLPAAPYHLKASELVLSDEYAFGRRYPVGSTSGINARLSSFDYGEGWTGPRLQRGTTTDYTLPVVSPNSGGPLPRLTLVLNGRNQRRHRVTVQVGSNAGSLRTLTEANFVYEDSYTLEETLSWSDVGSDQFTVRLTVNGVDGEADNVSLAYARLTYAQQADAEGQALAINLPAGAAKTYVEVDNPPSGPILLDVTDPVSPEQIGTSLIGGRTAAIVPNTNGARQLLLSDAKLVPRIQRTDFERLDAGATLLMISHRALHRPAGQYSDPVAAYQDYRSSPEGGGHAVLSVDVQQLYDQFNYGETSALAIRRFCHYMISKGNPEYLFIIGKGLKVNYDYHRKANPADEGLVHFVPTGGHPGSDIVFTAGLEGSDGVGAALATGRINVRSAQEVANYLDKVKEQEARGITADYEAATAREALWKKRLVHLSGGVTTGELATFGRYVNDFESVVVDDHLGGRVSTQSKQTNNATELINISDEVNKGVALITFFGHSSATRTDIEIGDVSNDELGYRNQGKYTAILLNGCNAGSIFNPAATFGENWIGTANRGALHVLAHSSTGLSGILKQYSDNFYQTAFGDSLWIDQPVGRVKNEAERRFIDNTGNPWEAYTAQVQQLVLQGDPSISLFGRGLPDYDISEDRLLVSSLDNNTVTASSDSFAVDVIVRNFGRTGPDSLTVRINRTLGDGTQVSYGPRYFPAVRYQDTLRFVIAANENETSPDQRAGDNAFEVIVDEANEVAEINENNNQTALTYFVPTSGTINVLPHNYALLAQPEVVLRVQPGNLQNAWQSAEARDFLIELDTSTRFESPIRQRISATALASWSVTLPEATDSTVYYWRSKYADPQPGEVDIWTVSSFTYVADSPHGWVQRQAPQWLENRVQGLTYDGEWKFEETNLSVRVDAHGSDSEAVAPTVLINEKSFVLESSGKCRDNSLNAIAFDRYSLQPYLVVKRGGFDEGDRNSCGVLPQVVNTFSNGQVTSNAILTQYVDAASDGDPILLFSIGQLNYLVWDASVRAELTRIGVDVADLDGLQAGEPLIILGRKNASPGSAVVVRANAEGEAAVTAQTISLDEQVTGQFSQGSIVSQRIGPASAWGDLQLQLAREASDSLRVTLIGERMDGQTTVLAELAEQRQMDLSSIDVSEYPYLKLDWRVSDTENLTPAQLRQWLITYEGVPEGTLLPSATRADSSLQAEGEPFAASFDFYNLSTYDFKDSLTVTYAFSNPQTRVGSEETLRIGPLAADDTTTFQVTTSTTGKAGSNNLALYVNPRLLPEQRYDNNQLNLSNFLTVVSDVSHPVLDVAFDGVYIRDGDIVSPQPLISVTVRDENPVLRKQDTTGIQLFLRKNTADSTTAAADFQRVRLSGDEISYTAASDSLPFALTYQPTLADGLYTLRVQAEDESGNPSGKQPYEINFEVVSASTIIYHYPYPNPLSTHTRFALTFTGTTPPDGVAIQIMNITGQVVREITSEEIGPLRAGSENIQYRWDGRDAFGNQLTSGMYLYRILVVGSGFEHREATVGKAFGKLYIAR